MAKKESITDSVISMEYMGVGKSMSEEDFKKLQRSCEKLVKKSKDELREAPWLQSHGDMIVAGGETDGPSVEEKEGKAAKRKSKRKEG